MDARQGPHHVAQNSTTYTFCGSNDFTSSPFTHVSTDREGAGMLALIALGNVSTVGGPFGQGACALSVVLNAIRMGRSVVRNIKSPRDKS